MGFADDIVLLADGVAKLSVMLKVNQRRSNNNRADIQSEQVKDTFNKGERQAPNRICPARKSGPSNEEERLLQISGMQTSI